MAGVLRVTKTAAEATRDDCDRMAAGVHQARRRFRILTVVNFRLPPTDYRYQFGVRSHLVDMVFGLPEPPPGDGEVAYVRFRFGEGVRPIEAVEFVRLFRWLRQERGRLDFVHFFSTKLFLFGPFVARLAGVRSLTTMTGFGRVFNEERAWWRPVRHLFLRLLGRAFACSDAVLFQNHGDMDEVLARFPSLRPKAHYVGSAVHLDVDTTKRDFRAESLVVLLVSRLVPSKGVPDFVEVATTLHKEGFRFVLVGPPSADYPGLADRVRDADAEGILTYAGIQGGPELRSTYERAHIFLFPSYGEGMARVMLEAGFAELCPVAYDINANRDVVAEGAGHLVALGDRAALVDRLRQLKADRDGLASTAARYRQRVSDTFSMDAYERRFVEVLRTTAPEHIGRVAD